MPYLSERRLYLAADDVTVVEEGDERAAVLLVGAGGVLSDADAQRYGLPVGPLPDGVPAPGERAIAPDVRPLDAAEASPTTEREAEEDAQAAAEKAAAEADAKARSAPPATKAKPASERK